jgi:hypothetical protein
MGTYSSRTRTCSSSSTLTTRSPMRSLTRAPRMPTRHGTSRTALGWTCACTSRTTRADLASPTTPSPDARPRTRRTPGLLPSWAPLPALLNRSCCRATTYRIQPPGWPPSLSASSSRCTRTSNNTMIASISRQQHSPHRRLVQAAALLQMQAQTHSLSPHPARQRPRQTRPSATQPPPRGIQAESGFPPGVLQLSGPVAHSSAQTHSVATPTHAAAHQALAQIQGLASALRGR